VSDGRNGEPAPDYAIDVQGVGVRYNLRLTRQTTVRTSFRNMFKRREGPTHFWALRDVSFRVVHGESLAVIGPNGAGKSTLLQVLAGIIQPNEGSVDVVGHVSSLLTLGAGFDQDLSGRDNIRLAGAFLGISHRMMEERLSGIVDFADIGEFIDAPIKTYSSGMRARLGFSIATAVDPDVLIIDEVLGTGDAVFRAKSKQRIIELTKAAKGIVLVTHDMTWVTEFCNRAMLLDHGHVIMEGAPADVVKLHEERSEQARIERDAELARKLAAVEGTLPGPAG
jgi:homopolymeric O-antigen transport system ATP-binding protein